MTCSVVDFLRLTQSGEIILLFCFIYTRLFLYFRGPLRVETLKVVHTGVGAGRQSGSNLLHQVYALSDPEGSLILTMMWISFKDHALIFLVIFFFFTIFPQIVDFADKISFYVMGCVSFFKSSRDDIKANAALFTGKVTELHVLLTKFTFPSFVFVTQSLCLIFLGFILGNLPKERRNEISKDHVCGGKIRYTFLSAQLVEQKLAELAPCVQSFLLSSS